MNLNNQETTKDFFKDQKNVLRVSLDDLFSKIKSLISKYKDLKNENNLLKENLKNLNLKISELKLQHTKLNTEIINRDKENSDLKNVVLNSGDNKIPMKDKDYAKTRIQDLITRIDTHLDQYDNDGEYRDN
ncbi:MAG TPA: hypothetical protein PK294_13705 [Ignavibacteria bacterium]|nr:hypothetical protein [Ignavibacteria bacterium]HQY53211.1 hypothetical protein [Ignavibacteria bacterium]HRB01484.1 hypothetical protein [Ignavibacteria bacterium]